MAASFLLVSILGVLMMPWSSQAQKQIGCFSFNHDHTVLSAKAHEKIGSIEECIKLCGTLKATYAGVRYGSDCFCGDNHDHTVNGEQLDYSSCSTPCNDQTLGCGGQFSIVIYSVCSPGRYRDNTNDDYNCDASCNCKGNGICLYNTGSCPADCETGWSGEACNVRVVQPTTEAATLIQKTDNGVTVSPQRTALTDEGAEVTVSQPTTIMTEDEHLTSSDGVPENITANPALSVTPCEGCAALLVALCVTSVGLVISIIVNIYLAYRLRVARINEKQSSANIRATHNSSDRNSNDTQYENMGGVQTEPSNYEHLGSRQTNPATYEELGMAGLTRG